MWINLERKDIETAIRHLRKHSCENIANRIAKQVTAFAPYEHSGTTDLHKAARSKYHSEGSIEIDSNAVISEGKEGAYIMGWLWVDYSDINYLLARNDASH